MSTGDRKAYLATILSERRTLKNPREGFMRDGFDYASQRMGEFAHPRKLEKGELLDIRKHRPALDMPEEIVNPYQAEAVETMQGMGVHMRKHRAPKSSMYHEQCMCSDGSAKPRKQKKAPMVHEFGMGAGGRKPTSMPFPSVDHSLSGGSSMSRVVGAAKSRRAVPAPSKWIEHVKAFAAKHGVSYKEAMSAAKSSYQK